MEVLYAFLLLGGLGLVFGIILAICAKIFYVKEDTRVVDVKENANYIFLAVAVSVCLVVVVAKIIATILPLGAKLLKLDPALMAGPLVTTIADAIAILIYFSIAKEFLLPLF